MEVENSTKSLRSIIKIFTAPSFRKIIDEDQFEILDTRVSKFIFKDKNYTRNEQIQFIYKFLNKNYRAEYIYKNTLLNKILLGKYSTNTSTAFDEFKIGISIADFVLLNGEAKVYEIKTEFDSLEKLDKQINDYKKFADKIYVVTNSKFLPTLIERYSKTTIGIIELTNKNSLRTQIYAQSNEDFFEHEIIFKTLRKHEYCRIIKDYYGSVPDLPNTRIFKECLQQIKKIPIIDFQKSALKILKQRKLKCPEHLNAKSTPYELKYLCHSLDFEEEQYLRLQKFLNQYN